MEIQIFIVRPMCSILYAIPFMATVFFWLLALQTLTNPPRVCLMAKFTDSANAHLLLDCFVKF
jgi:hypothetical protein